MRLIDADSFKDNLDIKARWDDDYEMDKFVRYMDEEPTVDAVPVVHGRWEPRKDVPGFVRCSVCHDCIIYDDWADGKKWNYCPQCGAKMDGGAAHENHAKTI